MPWVWGRKVPRLIPASEIFEKTAALKLADAAGHSMAREHAVEELAKMAGLALVGRLSPEEWQLLKEAGIFSSLGQRIARTGVGRSVESGLRRAGGALGGGAKKTWNLGPGRLRRAPGAAQAGSSASMYPRKAPAKAPPRGAAKYDATGAAPSNRVGQSGGIVDPAQSPAGMNKRPAPASAATSGGQGAVSPKGKGMGWGRALPWMAAGGLGYGLYKGVPWAARQLEQSSASPMAHGGGWSPTPYGYGYSPYGQGSPNMGYG